MCFLINYLPSNSPVQNSLPTHLKFNVFAVSIDQCQLAVIYDGVQQIMYSNQQKLGIMLSVNLCF
jgi:hypothetical protein